MPATFRVSVSTGPVLARAVAEALAARPLFRCAHAGTYEAHAYVTTPDAPAACELALGAVRAVFPRWQSRDVFAVQVFHPAAHPAGAFPS